jgi:hypothetical protein
VLTPWGWAGEAVGDGGQLVPDGVRLQLLLLRRRRGHRGGGTTTLGVGTRERREDRLWFDEWWQPRSRCAAQAKVELKSNSGEGRGGLGSRDGW